MINRISEIPFWGPEEQIRRFINKHDDPYEVYSQATTDMLNSALLLLGKTATELRGKTDEWKREQIKTIIKDGAPSSATTDAQKESYFRSQLARYFPTQQTVTQQRIENIDRIFQKQLIWSYGKPRMDDAYFYWDWCPIGTNSGTDDPKWQISRWEEFQENLTRGIDRTFKWKDFQGYTNTRNVDEMVLDYDSRDDVHTRDADTVDEDSIVDLDKDTLRHNIMRSYLEVSEWLGDGATKYGSHNGFVSRKMSMCWLFDAIRALINWKLENQDKWAEKDIYPLDIDDHHEHFLTNGEQSDCGIVGGTENGNYSDYQDLDQRNGRCARQVKERSSKPNLNGVLKVRGNEWHYGERADFYTHTSFIGECRFFHNVRFLGQTTFDKEINGTAMRSRWADLAEFKESDKAYEPGTLVMFGGEKEITLSRKGVCNAIVTTNPGLVLNGEKQPDKIMVGIALTGTVPVKIVGKVKKFDRLVASSTYPGYARAKKWYDFFKKPIAVALEDSELAFGDFVNCITKMEF